MNPEFNGRERTLNPRNPVPEWKESYKSSFPIYPSSPKGSSYFQQLEFQFLDEMNIPCTLNI